MCAMKVNELTKLTVSELAFQLIFHFVHWYWCYELLCIKGCCITQKILNDRSAISSQD